MAKFERRAGAGFGHGGHGCLQMHTSCRPRRQRTDGGMLTRCGHLAAAIPVALAGVLGAVGVAPLQSAWASTGVGASSCFYQTHIMDISCVNGSNGETYRGASMGFDARPIYVNCADSRVIAGKWHVNDSLWAFTSSNDNPGQSDMEVGFWNGYSTWDTTCNSSSSQAQIYYQNYDANGVQTTNRWIYVPLNSANHTVEITRDPNNQNYWYERYDGNVMWHATGQASSTLYETAVGLELGENQGGADLTWATTSTVHNSMTYVNTSNQWVSWPYYKTFRPQRCGLYPAGDCTNGSWPWQSEWDVNRG